MAAGERFHDRVDAGRRLAGALLHLKDEDPVVLGLPRGGVPVAAEVARALGAPLDVLVVRKLGVPSQPELAMGAIGEGGVRVLDDSVLRAASVTGGELSRVERKEREELARRSSRLRSGRPPHPLTGRTALVVDDGLATGSTARAACKVARAQGARRVVLAAPVGAPDAVERLRGEADEVVCLSTPRHFMAVGQWYDDFRATTDDEVERLLAEADPPVAPAGGEDVVVPAGPVRLPGRLTVPAGASEVVVFAHGSGSSRHSRRNVAVARTLEQAGLGTLLLDLLTTQEEQHRSAVFDVPELGTRLVAVSTWLRERPGTRGLGTAYFGASTGAAAALWAAAELGPEVRAVVSRGGRPDLAGPRLGDVQAPTLLVVGGLDPQVLALNRQAAAQLRCEHELVVVPGATHLFEEPGRLAAVAELARDWFTTHLSAPGVAHPDGWEP